MMTTYTLDIALQESDTPEFDEWWGAENEFYEGRSRLGALKTNGDLVMSIWGNPWMKVYAMKIFNAGVEFGKKKSET